MILYFSATGNSKYVAKRIADATGEKLISITDCIKENIHSFTIEPGEIIGVVSPVYFWELPEIVGRFINRCEFFKTEDPYCFFVATYGRNAGISGRNIKADFAERKIKLSARFDVKMVDTYTPVYYVNDEKENDSINQKAEKQIDKTIEQIKARETGDFMINIASPWAAKLSRIGYEKARLTEFFSVSDSCNGCGKCADICPEGAIKIEDGKPVWKEEKCLLCLACLHRCPQFAIQYKKSTQGKGQYTNPNVELE
jgi:ferredoxin